jgi:hypothetical protein
MKLRPLSHIRDFEGYESTFIEKPLVSWELESSNYLPLLLFK